MILKRVAAYLKHYFPSHSSSGAEKPETRPVDSSHLSKTAAKPEIFPYRLERDREPIKLFEKEITAFACNNAGAYARYVAGSTFGRTDSSERILDLDRTSDITASAIAPDGTIAVSTKDGDLKLYFPEKDPLTLELNGPAGAIAFDMLSDKMAVSVPSSLELHMIDLNRLRKYPDTVIPIKKPYASIAAGPLAFSPGGSHLAAGSSSNLFVYNLTKSKPPKSIPFSSEVTEVQYSLFATIHAPTVGCKNGQVGLIRDPQSIIFASLPEQTSEVLSLSFQPGGELLAVGRRDSIELWNANPRPDLLTINPQQGFTFKQVGKSPTDGSLFRCDFERKDRLTVAQNSLEPGSGRTCGSIFNYRLIENK